MYNLIIAYDLSLLGTQNYEGVEAAIEALGAWAHIQQSVWYVQCPYDAQTVENFIWQYMDRGDRLIVIEASSAWWHNMIADGSFVQSHWIGAA